MNFGQFGGIRRQCDAQQSAVLLHAFQAQMHEPESSDSLAEKAIRLVNDRELLMTMKQNAIGHVARFSFAHYSELINNLYSKL